MRTQDIPHIRLIASLACLCILTFLTPQVSATPVAVLAGDERGQGLARKRGTECLVIVPAHLLPPPVRRTRAEFTVVGPGGARGRAAFVEQIGTDDDDVAILRMTENERFVCDTSEAPTLKSKQAAVLALRSENGDLLFGPVDVVAQAGKTLEIEPRSEFFTVQRSMSGAVLIEAGRSRGVLVSAATQDSDLAFVRSIDYIAGLTGTWAKDPAEDVSSIKDALDIISQAIETRPAGDIGQIAAAETLTREGSPLEGLDLGGLSLENAFLANARLKGSRFYVSTLDNADLTGADLTLARFRYADLRAIRADEANLTRARFTLANAAKASFTKANAVSSDWFGADLSGADFKGADLKGAHFLYANLEGANFTGADLTNATFAAANVRGAVFDGAVLDNTDFTDARGSISQFSADQSSGLCARLVDTDLWKLRIEIIPVDAEGDRISRNALVATVNTAMGQYASGRLDPCEAVANPEGFEPIWGHAYANQYLWTTIRLSMLKDLEQGEIRAGRIRRNVVGRIAQQNRMLGYCNRLEDGSPPRNDSLACPRAQGANIPLDVIVQARRDASERLAELKANLKTMEPFPEEQFMSAEHFMIRYDKAFRQRYLDGEGDVKAGLPQDLLGAYEKKHKKLYRTFDAPMKQELRRYGVRQIGKLARELTLQHDIRNTLGICQEGEFCDSDLPARFARFELSDEDWELIEKRFGTRRDRWPTVLFYKNTILLSDLPKDRFQLGNKPELRNEVSRDNNQTVWERPSPQTKMTLQILKGGLVSRKPPNLRLTADQSVSQSYARQADARKGKFHVPWRRDSFDPNQETLRVLLVGDVSVKTGLKGLGWSEAQGFH